VEDAEAGTLHCDDRIAIADRTEARRTWAPPIRRAPSRGAGWSSCALVGCVRHASEPVHLFLRPLRYATAPAVLVGVTVGFLAKARVRPLIIPDGRLQKVGLCPTLVIVCPAGRREDPSVSCLSGGSVENVPFPSHTVLLARCPRSSAARTLSHPERGPLRRPPRFLVPKRARRVDETPARPRPARAPFLRRELLDGRRFTAFRQGQRASGCAAATPIRYNGSSTSTARRGRASPPAFLVISRPGRAIDGDGSPFDRPARLARWRSSRACASRVEGIGALRSHERADAKVLPPARRSAYGDRGGGGATRSDAELGWASSWASIVRLERLEPYPLTRVSKTQPRGGRVG